MIDNWIPNPADEKTISASQSAPPVTTSLPSQIDIDNQHLPKYLSSDNDPLFRFHRWLANLRVLEVEEIKSLSCVPRSHPFIERLIGMARLEYLDQTFFWNRLDLERKLNAFKVYYNEHRIHASLSGKTPSEKYGNPLAQARQSA